MEHILNHRDCQKRARNELETSQKRVKEGTETRQKRSRNEAETRHIGVPRMGLFWQPGWLVGIGNGGVGMGNGVELALAMGC